MIIHISVHNCTYPSLSSYKSLSSDEHSMCLCNTNNYIHEEIILEHMVATDAEYPQKAFFTLDILTNVFFVYIKSKLKVYAQLIISSCTPKHNKSKLNGFPLYINLIISYIFYDIAS